MYLLFLTLCQCDFGVKANLKFKFETMVECTDALEYVKKEYSDEWTVVNSECKKPK